MVFLFSLCYRGKSHVDRSRKVSSNGLPSRSVGRRVTDPSLHTYLTRSSVVVTEVTSLSKVGVVTRDLGPQCVDKNVTSTMTHYLYLCHINFPPSPLFSFYLVSSVCSMLYLFGTLVVRFTFFVHCFCGI